MPKRCAIGAMIACALLLASRTAMSGVIPSFELGTNVTDPIHFESLGAFYSPHEAGSTSRHFVGGVTLEVPLIPTFSIRFGMRTLQRTGRVEQHGTSIYYRWSGEDRVEESGVVYHALLTLRPGPWHRLFVMIGPEVVDRRRAQLIHDETVRDSLNNVFRYHSDSNVLWLLHTPQLSLGAGIGAEIPIGSVLGVILLRYSGTVTENVRPYSYGDDDPLQYYRWKEREVLLMVGLAGR